MEQRTCKVAGCDREPKGRGWCLMHYKRWRKTGDPGEAASRHVPRQIRRCSVRECVVCAEMFQPRRHGDSQIYCSKPCSQRASYLRNRTSKSAPRRPSYGQKWREDPEYRQAQLDAARFIHLRRKYGLTRAAFEALLAAQDGRCAICRTDKPDDTGLGWNVDHCHETGRIRGLLCRRCNGGLGWFKDNPEALRRAAAYVEEAACALASPEGRGSSGDT